MSSTAEGRKANEWYATERALAPHVDEKWAEGFIVELHLLHIEGARIGAALSEVESHCSESGQSAQDAFGKPAEYARSLRLPVERDDWKRAMLVPLAPVVVQVVGMLVFSWSMGAVGNGQQLVITTGNVIIWLLLLLAMTAMVLFFESVLRMAVDHRIWSGILLVFAWIASTATLVVALTYFDGVIWRGSAGWGLAAGATVLAGGVVWAVMRLRAHRPMAFEEDPITSPFGQAGTGSSEEAPGSPRRPIRPSLLDKARDPHGRLSGSFWLATFGYVALIPLLTLFLFAITLLGHLTSTR